MTPRRLTAVLGLVALFAVACGNVEDDPRDGSAETGDAVAQVDAGGADAAPAYSVRGEMLTVVGHTISGTLSVAGSVTVSARGCAGVTCIEGNVVP